MRRNAVIGSYWDVYEIEPGNGVVFPIQKITHSTWYTFGYHFNSVTTEVSTYLNGSLVEVAGAANGIPAFTQINEFTFLGDTFPQGDIDDFEVHKYLDDVKVGTTGLGSTDIFSDDFESYTLGDEWDDGTSHPPWTSVSSDSPPPSGIATDGLTIAATPYGGTGLCMNFKSHNEKVFAVDITNLAGGKIGYDWAGTSGDVYIEFKMAFDSDFIAQVERANSFVDGVEAFAASSDTRPSGVTSLYLVDAPATGKLHYFHNGSWHQVLDA